jgi:clan AA aspartic protease
VTLRLQGREETISVDFVVDTGFEGELCIPPQVMARLDAAWRGDRWNLMADKSPRLTPFYDVAVEWDGEERVVEADQVDGRPLLGCMMMDGGVLQIEMHDGGEVSIET